MGPSGPYLHNKVPKNDNIYKAKKVQSTVDSLSPSTESRKLSWYIPWSQQRNLPWRMYYKNLLVIKWKPTTEFGARKIFNVCIPDLNFLDMFIRYGVQHSVILQVKNLVYAVHMLNSTWKSTIQRCLPLSVNPCNNTGQDTALVNHQYTSIVKVQCTLIELN